MKLEREHLIFDNLNLITDLTLEDQEWLRTNGNIKIFHAKDKLAHSGESLNEIFFVLKGLFLYGIENAENFLAIGPGGVIGTMPFLTNKIAPVSVEALEPGSTVLAISYEHIKSHIKEDPQFAKRFYRMTSIILSDRLKNLIALFIARPKSNTKNKYKPILVGPVPLFTNDQPDFNGLQNIFDSLPPLSDLLNKLEQGLNIQQELIERENKLSVATMSADSIEKLCKIASNEGVNDLPDRIIYHEASVSAAAKQALLPNLYIQKTITILLEDKFVLCSNISNLNVSHQLLSSISNELGIDRNTHDSYINPIAFIPEIELGLLRGMVSTFFSPRRITQLSLVTLVNTPTQPKDVAISLSPFESILIPMEIFPIITKKYAEWAYPYLPFKILESKEN